ncbi:hypothetical protein GCM10022254_58660 [Actinomadura meridiana]|uniref:Cupin type-2 domain-containing protein n=1 Tax=Actinomadura meridiana TaxID=559626 RepID=A0ABP8CHD7_9ACTN
MLTSPTRGIPPLATPSQNRLAPIDPCPAPPTSRTIANPQDDLAKHEIAETVTGRAHGAATDGEFGLYNVVGLPPAAETGTHFHKTMSESFFVTGGTVTLFDGERWIDATKGDFLYAPVGGLHAIKNDSDGPASFLMLFVPGAPREGYFEGGRRDRRTQRGGAEPVLRRA